MKKEWNLHSPNLKNGSYRSMILFLPGRGSYGHHFVKKYQRVFQFKNIGLASLSPSFVENGWYPLPNGANDQKKSIEGLQQSNEILEKTLDYIEKAKSIPREKILLCGYSAGAVVSLYNHTQTSRPCAGVIAHSGAILEPKKVPVASHENPIVLTHGKDDHCFSWEERYLPTRTSLIKNQYKIYTLERETGNHSLFDEDIIPCKKIIEQVLSEKINYTN